MAVRINAFQEELLEQHEAKQLRLKQRMRHKCAKLVETVTDLAARLEAATSECQDLSGESSEHCLQYCCHRWRTLLTGTRT